jgi:hypothetical protein
MSAFSTLPAFPRFPPDLLVRVFHLTAYNANYFSFGNEHNQMEENKFYESGCLWLKSYKEMKTERLTASCQHKRRYFFVQLANQACQVS